MIDQEQFEAEIRSAFFYLCEVQPRVGFNQRHVARRAWAVFFKGYESEQALDIMCEEDEEGARTWTVEEQWSEPTLREAIEQLQQHKREESRNLQTQISAYGLAPTMSKDKFLAEIRESLCHPDVWVIVDDEDPFDLDARVFLSSEEDAVANDEPLTVSYSFGSWKVGVSGGGVSFKEALGGHIENTLEDIKRKQRQHKRILTAMHDPKTKDDEGEPF